MKHMGDMDHKPIQPAPDQTGDDFDGMLDTALAKYAAVEPRTGLDERILANFRGERARVPNRAWWKWSLVAGITALVMVAATLAWRSRTTHPHVANHPPTTTEGPEKPHTQTANRDSNSNDATRRRAIRAAARNRPQAKGVVAASPKLDQFPSPQPLSEQERILTNYVANYPERAALLAEARMEALRHDAEERRQLAADDRISQQ